ncbi:MAG: helicase [Candidatus Tectomicrobia bacterium]|uniref:Helicase n=1 Tax=Tectimicrobiota bacterium TaxID=2528274 RepID=A0A937W2D5_UNCTE|nr:helicase [Candidatus Tectomicrobia bacterium]
MQAFFETVRQACAASEWSRGVELSRGGTVVVDHATPEEVMLKIATRGGMVSPTVTLWPAEKDWACSCPSQADVCAHVAAAVIVLHHAPAATPDGPTLRPVTGSVRYCFTRGQGGLVFERMLVQDGKVQRFEGTLATLTTGRTVAPRFVITQADLAVELALGPRRSGWLPREVMPKLLTALAQCADVRLDDLPVKAAAMPLGVRAYVTDEGQGFTLGIEPETPITEVFNNGVVLCGQTLRTVKEPALTARERDELRDGRYFTAAEAPELVTQVLPALRQRLPVEVRATRLPQIVSTPPRIILDVQREGHSLSVLPTLVYGTPPMARVDAGRLVQLGNALPRRDEAAEQRVMRQLRATLGLLPGRKTVFHEAEAVRFATQLATWDGEIRGQGHTAFTLTAALAPQVRLGDETFDCWFDLTSVGATRQTATRRVGAAVVLRAWQEGATMLPLAEGGWAPLPVDWLQRFGQRVVDLLAARTANGTLARYALPGLAQLCDELEQPRPPALAGLQALLDDFAGLPEAPLPADMPAVLRAYQQRGVNWLAFLRQAGLGALLADDMGLGKTLQTLCVLQGRTLVVTPTSVLHHWADELRRFRPGLQVALYHGAPRQLVPSADVTLTTYALLRLDIATLARETWDMVVLDEAQAIKNPDSQVARAAYKLPAHFRLVLTGTPIENRLDELWSQVHFLNPGLLGGRQAFQERYARPIADGQAAAATLRATLKPFVLRRRKREVAPELPPRTDVVLPCELSMPERVVYDTVRAATLANVVALLEAGGNVLAALEALLRLRQACCHAGLIPGQTASTSTKVALLLERLEEAVADGHKALVFSQWTALLDRVEPHLRATRLPFTRLDGHTRDRASVVRAFQEETGPPIMLVSLRAGGTGLNLTAADHIFLLDPWWNPAVEDQAADRAHRIGQTRPVMVYRLVTRDTVEERILALQARKRALAEAALEEAGQATAITREELLALLV